MNNRLGRIIEVESNKFIRERLREISLHHSEQMSLQISERKRKDHEQHLERLRLKEEQYNKELEQAMKEKKGGFFSIFNFSNQQPTILPSKSETFNDTLFDVAELSSPIPESANNNDNKTPDESSDEDFAEFTSSPLPLEPTTLLVSRQKPDPNDVSLLDL